MQRGLKILKKATFWTLAIIIALILLINILIRIPAVQNFAKDKAVNYLNERLGTKVAVDNLSISFPKMILLEGVYFEDLNQDTLIAGDTMLVDISMLKLFKNTLEINRIDLRGITLNVSRNADSLFNFDYILDSLATQSPTQDSTGSDMTISLRKVSLSRVKSRYLDDIENIQASLNLGSLDVRVRNFDLEKQQYSVPSISLSNTQATFIKGRLSDNSVPDTSSRGSVQTTMPFEIELDKVDFNNVSFDYADSTTTTILESNFGELAIDFDTLNLKGESVSIKDLKMDKSAITFTTNAPPSNTDSGQINESAGVEVLSTTWDVRLGKINLNNSSVQYDNTAIAATNNGVDFNHLAISELNLKGNDIQYTHEQVGATLLEFSFSEKGGVKLRELTGDVQIQRGQASIKDLILDFNDTRLIATTELKYPELDNMLNDLKTLHQNTIIRESKISLKDILLITPGLADTEPFKSYGNEILTLEGSLEGYLNDLNIASFHLAGLDNTEITAKGNVKGLPDAARLSYNLDIRNLTTERKDILAFLPKGTVPENIQLPSSMNLSGTVEGNTGSLKSNLKLNTSDGDATINGFLAWSDTLRFEGQASLSELNLGKILMQDSTIGKFTFNLEGKIKGYEPETLTGNVKGTIERIDLMGYTYKDIRLSAIAEQGDILLAATLKDKNLEFDIDGNANLSGEAPRTTFHLDLIHADLLALGYAEKKLDIQTYVRGSFRSINPDSLIGTMAIGETQIQDSARTYSIDSIYIEANASPDSNTLQLTSGIIDARISGKYNLTTLAPAIAQSIDKYYDILPDTARTEYEPYNVNFNAEIKYNPLLTQLDTNIGQFSPIQLFGTIDGASESIQFTGLSEKILYSDAVIEQFNLQVESDGPGLDYAFVLQQADYGNIEIGQVEMYGSLEGDIISANLRIIDDENESRFNISSTLENVKDQMIFSLIPGNLILNYENWNISSDNSILIADQGMIISNFVLSQGDQRLDIRSEPNGFNNPIKVEFSDFQIQAISGIISRDSAFIGGTVNGNALVKNYMENPEFSADLDVQNFSFKTDTLGNISLNVRNESATSLFAEVEITNKGNQLNLEGRYYIENQGVDLNLDLKNLNLATVESFSLGAIEQARGSMKGELSVKGTIFEPMVKGSLSFEEAGMHINSVNAFYELESEGVSFDNSDLYFDDFTMTDSEGNAVNVNGVIYTTTFTDFSFDLNIRSNNFKVLDTDSGDNDLYYGALYLDSDIDISGALNSPEVNADINVRENTDMTIVLPQSSPGIVAREGVVQFVDLDNPKLDSILRQDLDTLNTFSIKGITAFASIKVTNESEYTLIIDQGNGDYLKVRGDAELSASIDQSGKISLTGNYVLAEGVYELSFNFIKRKFEIEKGSTITWNGEPTSGKIDITAVYVVEAAPIDLVERQLGSASQAELNLYKEKLPFRLILDLSGELMEPQVAFDIELPEGNYSVAPEVVSNVEAKLQQLERNESEMNKQAFALVLLNRFISDNPLKSSAGGTSAESYARQSVSKLLSQQLNNLAGNLIAGVDLNFDLEATEDYSTGQLQNRTDLNVSASKRLLNDRIEVTVGSNFELEGSSQAAEKASNIAGDISVEYQLSKDGRYLLKAYRKNEYQVAVEGHVIETGLSFVIQIDYDKFREIFSKRKKKEN